MTTVRKICDPNKLGRKTLTKEERISFVEFSMTDEMIDEIDKFDLTYTKARILCKKFKEKTGILVPPQFPVTLLRSGLQKSISDDGKIEYAFTEIEYDFDRFITSPSDLYNRFTKKLTEKTQKQESKTEE